MCHIYSSNFPSFPSSLFLNSQTEVIQVSGTQIATALLHSHVYFGAFVLKIIHVITNLRTHSLEVIIMNNIGVSSYVICMHNQTETYTHKYTHRLLFTNVQQLVSFSLTIHWRHLSLGRYLSLPYSF